MKTRTAARRSKTSARHGAPQLRLGAWTEREIIVDLFAGGGGASEGISRALGRHPDIAVNHDPAAIAMHKANHPSTIHFCESVFKVTPRDATGGRPVGFLWASPDCTHHSKAKGGKPRKKKIRGLAWVVTRWAKEVRPRVIAMENVEEWLDWGPLDADDMPDKARAGQTFRAWCRKLESYGYVVEHRILIAADYGAPTTRKRLFVVARCDGAAIEWPAPSRAKAGTGPRAWRTAAECMDWSLPVPSIFERGKRLAEATERRIAAGMFRYVIGAARPFIVPLTHHGAASRVHSIDEPMRTVTGAHRGELALIAPTLVQTGYGEREGQAPRALDLHRPLGTVVAGGAKHALVAAFLTKHYGGVVGHEVTRPIGTVTTQDHHSLTTAWLVSHYGQSVGRAVDAPLPTVKAGGGGHTGLVHAFLVKYYGTGTGQRLDAPLATVTTRDRFGLVTVEGCDYEIADIGMRMLAPRELFRAQGFGDHYIIDPVFRGKPLTKTEQIAKCGNSVCPPLSEAITRANVRLDSRAAA